MTDAALSRIDSLNRDFLEEYRSAESIRKYTKETAGHGISYLLDHDYGQIYIDVLERYVSKSNVQKGVRLLEFGCGAGMNLIHLVSSIEERGMTVDCAYGTDFSDKLIEAARLGSKRYLTPRQNAKVRFCVARNETLVADAAQALGVSESDLLGSFDFILGVNTIRYCHRLKNQDQCASGMLGLLRRGGVCVVIDMNDRFPAFRSRFRDRRSQEQDKEARYLPSLDEYAAPFRSSGFEILEKRHFCWVPHSAGRGLTALMRGLAPVLAVIAPDRAMRSLVIARKNRDCRS
jgi:SAM-dependent methyltransferase